MIQSDLCIECCEQPITLPRPRLCMPCYQRKYRAGEMGRAAQTSRCLCGGTARRGRMLCSRCIDKQASAIAREKRREYQAALKCSDCGTGENVMPFIAKCNRCYRKAVNFTELRVSGAATCKCGRAAALSKNECHACKYQRELHSRTAARLAGRRVKHYDDQPIRG